MPAPFHLDRRQTRRLGERFEADLAELSDASVAAVSYAQRRGGGFYDLLRVASTRVLFGLLDFVDGDRKAKMAEAAETAFRDVGARVFREPQVNLAEAMIELCLELNRTLLETSGQARSCPAFVACYEESLGTAWYVNAGPAAALVRDPTGVAELPATGLALGLFSHATCDASAVALVPGAALLVVSRGIVERKVPGQEAGIEAVKTALLETAAANAQEMGVAVLTRLEQRIAPHPEQGTAVALVRSTSASSSDSGTRP